MIDMKKVKEEVEKELNDELVKEAKLKIKRKMIELRNAEKVLKNIKRELVDLR